jgi:folylpolyglutamate synthase/dihydropteroate synthase
MSRDKDVRGVAAILARRVDRVFCTTARTPRSAPPDLLADSCRAAGCRDVEARDDPIDAFTEAVAGALPEEIVLITGSFYIAGAAYRYFERPEL